MSQLLEGTRLRRRSFLRGSGLVVAGIAGCIDDDPATDADASGGGGDGGSDDDGGGGDDDGPDAEDAETSLSRPAAPEPDFTVGESDDADYGTLQEAYEALESGDVIGLEPGSYTLQPAVDNADVGDGEDLLKTYTYVGESAESTTIEFVKPDARSFIVRGPQRFRPEDGPPGFWNLTLEIPEDVTFQRIDAYEDKSALRDYLNEAVGEADGDVVDAYPDAQTGVNYCTVVGTLDGPVDAYESTFADDVSHELSPTDCHFQGDVSGSKLTARRCQFDGSLDSDSGWIVDSTIEGPVSLNHVTMIRCTLRNGLYVTGNGRVEDCVVHTLPDSDRAIEILSTYDVAVTESEIYGTVRSNQDGSYIDRFELNVFEAPSRSDYIIDGAPATDIYLNAFVGGDVRITTDTGDLSTFPADELTLYDPERELGNHYSEWDGEEVDDGILRTRTLPGADGKMDRYPLAGPDVEAYAEAAAEDD